jgi:16S rRNA processing protein RimM
MAKLKNPVQMAVVGAPHGVKGDVRVKTFTGDPMALGDYGALFDKAGRSFEVLDIRPAGTVVVVRFKGITTREQAEALNGVALFVERAALPEGLEEEEFYHADLIGLAVVDEAGAAVGKVIAIHDFGGGDILEIRLDGKRTALIPFTRAAVPELNMQGKKVRIDSIAAGLTEGEEASGENP